MSKIIKLTRLNESELVVNADLIETIEATPDTVVKLTTGDRFVVREDVDEVIKKVIKYKREVQLQIQPE